MTTLLHTNAHSPLATAYPDWWADLLKWMESEDLNPMDAVELTVTDDEHGLRAYVVEVRRGPHGYILADGDSPATASRTVPVSTPPPILHAPAATTMGEKA